MKKKYFPLVGMGFFLLLTESLSIFLSGFFKAYDLKAFENNPDSVMNPIYLILMILGFTILFLLVDKFDLSRFIQFFIGIAVFTTLVYSLMAFIWNFYPLEIENLFILASFFSLVIVLLYLRYKRWYMINLVGILVAGGAAAIFGFSLSYIPVIVLLIALAIYDAIAVYKTKHMISLAGSAIELKIPIMFIMPWKKDFSLDNQDLEEDKKEAFFMGVGDAVMPSILVVSSYIYLDTLIIPIFVAFGSLIGFVFLSYLVLKGKAQAGLPLLNGGAIVGFLIPYFLI
ncbi:hypothetical protein C9439_06475 [archaeon SCG-AAA382B04]|nr:hypothetical protein C9439_06475 [archaeon SCG-AAA382B04]